MPAKSQAQQKLMGMADSYKKGTLKGPVSSEVKKVATSMTRKQIREFASTSRSGLPKKVKKK